MDSSWKTKRLRRGQMSNGNIHNVLVTEYINNMSKDIVLTVTCYEWRKCWLKLNKQHDIVLSYC